MTLTRTAVRAASTAASVAAKRAWPRSMSPSTVEILKATAPVVKEHGTAITSTMYKTMFATYPEVKNLFNMSHHRVHADGSEQTSQQARSLANAVFAFAANADRLGNLTDAVARMVHKHVSLDIRPEHYPIVGTCLLGSIQTTLQSAATPEIMAAWEEGYWFLADLLIDAENATRAKLEALPGGWSGFRKLRVDRKVRESDEITSFYLSSTDASAPLLPFEPGQYICLKFDDLQENVLLRNYSLSNAPNTAQYRISVKREGRDNGNIATGTAGKDGDGKPPGVISCHLHDRIDVGSTLLVAPPCGEFVLKHTSDKPAVFLAGGVGATALLSMLEALVAGGLTQRTVFVQYARTPEALAFRDHLEALERDNELLDVHTVLTSDGGAFDVAALESWLPTKDCEFYFCGTPGFLATVNKALATEWQTPATQRHFEYFGPTQDINAA